MTRSSSRGAAAALAFAMLVGTSPIAAASGIPVTISSVTDTVSGSASLKGLLQTRLEQELKALYRGRKSQPAFYTAVGSIVKLVQAKRPSGGSKVGCTIELTLIDSNQTLVAVVRGHASAEGASSRATLLRDALGGAAHSAVAQLPSAIRQVQGK